MKKVLFLTFLLIMPILSACSKDDDEPTVDSSEIQGVWECTSCEVIDIAGFNGLELPETVINIISNQLVSNMIGNQITISDKVKMNGDVLIFPDSGIKWKILDLSAKNMTVQYDTSSEASGYGMTMTVKTKYKKIK
ncbi:MAG: hypothetical protein K2K81_10695 [Muribaculaceae bacterium]|nr:hypothetical protein [Muribaculaceae bacterium]